MSIRSTRAYYWYLTGRAKYLFIHIPKNAGVAIRHATELRGRLVGAESLFHKSRAYTRHLRAAMDSTGDHHGIQHARLRDLSPRVRADLQAVAIIRNPWARVASRFTFAQKAMDSGAAPSDYAPRTFEAFVEERHVWGGREFFWHRAIRGWYPQVDYITDELGARPVDLLRAEHLDVEARTYFGLKGPLRHRNISNATHDHKAFYTKETIQTIADWYAADIATFGFDFDTPALRNVFYKKDDQLGVT